MDADAPTEGAITEPPEAEAAPVSQEDKQASSEAADAAVSETEMEVFYTFTWGGRAPRQNQRPQGNKPPRGKGKPKGKGGPKPDRNKPQSFSAKPKKEKAIDPDNPFAAALAGFKKD
jgi:ATP-dependent RNA helicase SUPV3L1/SUV3